MLPLIMLALPTELAANFVFVTAPVLSFDAVTEKSVIAVVVILTGEVQLCYQLLPTLVVLKNPPF